MLSLLCIKHISMAQVRFTISILFHNYPKHIVWLFILIGYINQINVVSSPMFKTTDGESHQEEKSKTTSKIHHVTSVSFGNENYD